MEINLLDGAFLVGLLVSALLGLVRGLIREALSVITWVGALWCAARFGGVAAEVFHKVLDDPLWQLWAGRLTVLIGLLFFGTLAAWMVNKFVRKSVLTGMDRFLGMLFGLARGVVFSGLVVLAMELAGFGAESWWQQSKLVRYASLVGVELRNAAQTQLTAFPRGSI